MIEDRGRGTPLPREGEQVWYHVWGLKGEGPERFGLYGDIWLGKVTHWDGCTFPCAERPDCRGCNQEEKTARIGTRWNGYIAGYSHLKKKDCVVVLTQGAANQLLPTYQAKGTLRGLTIDLYRKRTRHDRPPADNAPVFVREIGWTPESKLPAAFPIEYSLLRMWGIHAAFLEARQNTKGKPKRDAKMPPKLRRASENDIPI